MRAPTLDVATVERIYDHAYEQQFGRRSYRKQTPKNDLIFGKLVYLFASEGIDPATYITANMRAMRSFVADSPYGFQPNMLSGVRARGRYNGFIRHANRRYRRGLGDVAHGETDLGRLRRELVFAETDVGGFFVRFAWIRKAISWDEAIEMADPSSTWLDFHSGSGLTYQSWVSRLGVARVRQEIELMRLRAAVSVVNAFEIELADRIGVSEFSWEALAALIVRTFDAPQRPEFDLVGIPGGLWR